MKTVLIFRPSEHHNNSLTVVFGLALTQIIDVVSKSVKTIYGAVHK